MVFGDWLARSKHQPQQWYCQNTYDPQKDVINPPTTKEDETRKQANERYHELCQQWRSAEAAVEGTYVARLQFWMGWFGIALVIGTFVATAFAAYFAYRAAEATHIGAVADQDSAATANSTLDAMQRNAQRELRAYVFVEQASVTDIRSPDGYTVLIKSKNFGRTPASEYNNSIHIGIDTYPVATNPQPARPLDASRPTRSSFPPDAQLSGTHKMPRLTQQQIDNFNAGKLALYVVGEMTYRDAFGNPRRTWYRLYHNVECGPKTMRTTKEGNGHT